MANQAGKAIFIGNIKGGVTKVRLVVYSTDYSNIQRYSRQMAWSPIWYMLHHWIC